MVSMLYGRMGSAARSRADGLVVAAGQDGVGSSDSSDRAVATRPEVAGAPSAQSDVGRQLTLREQARSRGSFGQALVRGAQYFDDRAEEQEVLDEVLRSRFGRHRSGRDRMEHFQFIGVGVFV